MIQASSLLFAQLVKLTWLDPNQIASQGKWFFDNEFYLSPLNNIKCDHIGMLQNEANKSGHVMKTPLA